MSIDHAPLEDSLWYATAASPPDTRAIDGTVETDVCIVGAGYTGLSSALHLGECGVRSVVLEAQQIGHGGSGRNAGHCTPTFTHFSLGDLRKRLGRERADRLIARQTALAETWKALKAQGLADDAWGAAWTEARRKALKDGGFNVVF